MPRAPYKPIAIATNVDRPLHPQIISNPIAHSPFRDTAVMPCPHPQHYLRCYREKPPDNLPATALGDRP
ncbi:hypothetical protein QUA74_06010 [Microcoleus sp. LAD1_D3]|uniref:hypothetical protein n=1 Tax=Microcoleus sp. LAD1_D3 TaxID=2819365 RepID=UPI002FD12D53